MWNDIFGQEDRQFAPADPYTRPQRKRAPRGALSGSGQEEDLLLLYALGILRERAVGVDDVAVEVGRRAARLGSRHADSVLTARDDRVLLRRNGAAPILIDVEAPLVAPTVFAGEGLDVRRRQIG